MKLSIYPHTLQLKQRWILAGSEASAGRAEVQIVLVKLEDRSGIVGWGEASPSRRLGEDIEQTKQRLLGFTGESLKFENEIEGVSEISRQLSGSRAARAAIEMAFLDGVAKYAKLPLWKFWKVTQPGGISSFSIGIDSDKVVEEKARAVQNLPILKLKVGETSAVSLLAALRRGAPNVRVRVDANEAWHSREQALQNIEHLAKDGLVELVEQPMPAQTAEQDLIWLKQRSPIPLIADESFTRLEDIERILQCFHGINVKLMKLGSLELARQALVRAPDYAMLGCMIESSVGISAAAQLSSLARYIDLDGNMLISNDPASGAYLDAGALRFHAVEACGIGVTKIDATL